MASIYSGKRIARSNKTGCRSAFLSPRGRRARTPAKALMRLAQSNLGRRRPGADRRELGKSRPADPVGLLRDSTSSVVFALRATICRGRSSRASCGPRCARRGFARRGEPDFCVRAPRFCPGDGPTRRRCPWTDERVEQLKQHWLEGKSASQIASLLGHGLTRNAVIGKVHRLGLAGRAKSPNSGSLRPRRAAPAAVAHRAALPRAVQAAPRMTRGATALALAPEELAEMEPEVMESVVLPMSLRVTIVDLKESMCRWPLGDPATSDFRYCGSAHGVGPLLRLPLRARLSASPGSAARTRPHAPHRAALTGARPGPSLAKPLRPAYAPGARG